MSPATAGPIPIPPFDPLGLPVPAPILLALAYLTLAIHLLAMNFTLGGLVLLLWSMVRRGPGAAGNARFLGTGLPFGFSYLITFGVPPLLFIQVVYGQFFYPSSVLLGGFWILVIPLVITAYALSYAHRMTRERHPRPQPWLVALMLLAMLAVAFLLVNNLTLAQVPRRWLEMYATRPGGSLNLAEPTLAGRYLLFLSPAFIVAGLALLLRRAVLIDWGRPLADAEAAGRLGLRAVLLGTVLVVAALAVLLATLPAAVRQYLLSGSAATLVAAAAAVLGVATLVLVWLARQRTGLRLPVLAMVVFFAALLAVVVTRDLVRQEYLRPFLDLSAIPVRPQWGIFSLFAGSFAAMLVFLVAMAVKVLRQVAAAARTGPVPTPPEQKQPEQKQIKGAPDPA